VDALPDRRRTELSSPAKANRLMQKDKVRAQNRADAVEKSMSSAEIPVLSICVPTFNRQFLLERNINFHLDAFRKLDIPF
jgi:hypothetical protein